MARSENNAMKLESIFVRNVVCKFNVSSLLGLI